MPAEANSPPTSITGRQPKRVTRMLDTGPEGRAGSEPLGLTRERPCPGLEPHSPPLMRTEDWKVEEARCPRLCHAWEWGDTLDLQSPAWVWGL